MDFCFPSTVRLSNMMSERFKIVQKLHSSERLLEQKVKPNFKQDVPEALDACHFPTSWRRIKLVEWT